MTGEIIDELSLNPSPADDHRQATPLEVWIDKENGFAVALGLWNGQFGLLDPVSMKWKWQIQLDGAIRARATKDNETLWVGTDNGSLYRLTMDGKISGKVDLGASIRTSPLVVEEGEVVAITAAGI
jgi:outer membrane protein assembly factor BamB